MVIRMNLGHEVSRRLRAADDAIFKARLGENPATTPIPLFARFVTPGFVAVSSLTRQA
jgi:hypothetical protein